ncbi:hypothetical protein QUC31_003793 [Theobroma cacao]
MQPKTACITCLITIIWWQLFLEESASASDPQINLLSSGCGQYNVTDYQDFRSNLNSTFIQLREQLVNDDKYFATAQQARGSNPAYAMVQCRKYLSSADCLACFEAALSRIRHCSSNGANVIYDGCCLRSHETNADPDAEFLLKKAWRLYENNMHLELADESLDPNENEAEDVKRVIEVALMCTQATAAMRPTMSEVVVLLKSKGSVERRPLTKPTFIESDHKRLREDTSTSTASSASNATASISRLSGR